MRLRYKIRDVCGGRHPACAALTPMAATATEAPAATSRRLVTLGVLTGTALAALEATVVGAAMPTVIASVGGLHHYSWVFAAYLVTSTVSVPVWGNQGVLGAGATGAGAALMPLMLGWVTFSVIGGRLLLRIGYRPTAIAGMALLTTGFVLLGLGDAASSRAAFYAQLALV
ncbi:MAG TPA: hypothetical protein VFO85_21360, partial [Vicinamibacteria bacterium]|nr:hypothetical protein [Vicinamibacteria bacterium]